MSLPSAATSAPPTTTPAQAAASPPAAAATESSSPPSSSSDASVPPLLHDTLPSASTERQIQSARAAVVASMSNMVDRELAPRARVLHDNTAALAAQEEQVARATGDMARANDRLQREADAAGAVLKEVGHVQNWAEVLEREFLVVEETLRLANGGSDDGSSGSLCSCSECGRDDNRQGADGEDDVVMPDAVADDKNKTEDKDGVTWSEASRSVQDSGASTASS